MRLDKRIRRVPGHCDPTVDYYAGMSGAVATGLTVSGCPGPVWDGAFFVSEADPMSLSGDGDLSPSPGH
jgi:hypothetical protein